MHKIYSRFRIRLPKIKLYHQNKGRTVSNKTKMKITKIFIIMVIAFSTIKIILDSVLPIFDTLCTDKAKSIATIVANEQATIVMKQHTYDELFTIEKDNNGNIVMIKSNVVPINEIISDIPNNIQKRIDELGRNDVEIALGSFTGIRLLAGRGPGVKIRISSIGNVHTDLRSEFISKGINQTLHRVYLQVRCEVSILTPFYDVKESIDNQVLLMENVIVGHVPNTYYNLEGLDGKSEALEVLE